MKTVSIAISLLSGLLMAAGHGQQVRVSVQYVELSHKDLTSLLAISPENGPLHGKAMELVRANKAGILETCIGVSQTGTQATFESVREEIYPTETEPPQLPCSSKPDPNFNSKPNHRSFTAFETHKAGTMLEVGADILDDDRFVKLQLLPEIGSRIRLDTMVEYKDQRGDASVRMPIYETWRTNTSLTLRSGKFALVSVIHPKRPQAAPFVDSRILFFVRADVIDVDR